MSEPKRPEGLTLERIAELRASNSNGTIYQDCSADERRQLFALAERALKQPRLTPHAVDVIRNLSFECYLPLDGFIERLKAFGIEVETEKR